MTVNPGTRPEISATVCLKGDRFTPDRAFASFRKWDAEIQVFTQAEEIQIDLAQAGAPFENQAIARSAKTLQYQRTKVISFDEIGTKTLRAGGESKQTIKTRRILMREWAFKRH